MAKSTTNAAPKAPKEPKAPKQSNTTTETTGTTTNAAPKAPKASTGQKLAGVSVVIAGSYIVKDDRKRDVKAYEETFLIPAAFKHMALSVICRCLLPFRLREKDPRFGFVRTHQIKGNITPVEDIGLGALLARDIFDLNAEEIRALALMVDIQIVDRHPETKKALRIYNAVEIIKGTAVDFDLKEKVKKFLADKPVKVQAAAAQPQEEAEETGETEETGAATEGEEGQQAGEKWEKLD